MVVDATDEFLIGYTGPSTGAGGRPPVLSNIEDAAGFLTDSDASLTVQSGALAVTTPAGTKYIPLYNPA